MSEPDQQLCDQKIVKLEILEENETPIFKDDVSAQETIKMEDTLNTSETDNSELMLTDLEPLNKADQLGIKLEPGVTCENKIKSPSTPDHESHSKIEIVNVGSMEHTKNNVGNETNVDKRTATPIVSISEETEYSEQMLTDNPSVQIEESQTNAEVNNQDCQLNMSTEDYPDDCGNKNNDSVRTQSGKCSAEIQVEKMKKEDIENISEKIDGGNKNNDNVNVTQTDKGSIMTLVEDIKKEYIENISEEMDDFLPPNPDDGGNKNNDNVNETQFDKGNIETQVEEIKKEHIENISEEIDYFLPPNPDDGGNKNNDNVNETQSNKGSIETQVEEIKKEHIENISEEIDDFKLESTNTPEKPQESNSNTPLIIVINDSLNDIEMEYSATQCNQDIQNMSTEDNSKESATNAIISVTSSAGALPPNPDDCGNKNNDSVNETQFDEGSHFSTYSINNDHSSQHIQNKVETQEIVSKPSEPDDIYSQFRSEIDALDSSENQSLNTASTSQNDNSAQNSSCEPKEVMGPSRQYKKDFVIVNDKLVLPHVYKLLGFQKRPKFFVAKKIIQDKAKLVNLLPMKFNPENETKVSKCTGICTKNWPTWVTPQTIRLVLVLLTDIDFNETECCIETLTYSDKKGMGAALISFTSPDVCFQVFDQLRKICLVNKDITFKLDFDNKVRQTFTGVFIHSGVEDGYTCTINEDKWLTRSEEISVYSDRVLRRVTVTSEEAPPDYKPDTKPSVGPPRLDPTDDQQRAELKVIHEMLGLQDLLFSPYFVAKRQLRNKMAELRSTKMPEPPPCKFCTCIYIDRVPTWFEYVHFLYLFEIATTIKWKTLHYYIEILKYSNGVNRGAALLHLRNMDTCHKIFTELRVLCFLKENKKDNIFVALDPSKYVGTVRQILKGPVVSQISVDQLKKSQSDSAENFAADIDVADHTKSQDHADINTEIPEDIDLKQIINEDLMDIDFNAMAEDTAQNSNESSEPGDGDGGGDEDVSSTQHNTAHQGNDEISTQAGTSSLSKEPVRSCLVHMKLLPPGYKSHGFYQILSRTRGFGLSTKYYGIRFLRDEDKRIMNECLLKFGSPHDAYIVTQKLDGLTFKNLQVQAKLLQDSNLPSWGNDSFEPSNPLKRKLDNGDDDQHKTSTSKKFKFDEEWEIGSYERGHTVSDSTEEKFGVNPFLLKKLNVKRFISPNIVISNLHKDVTENKLREIFSLAGRVVIVTKICRVQGYIAKIEYEHPLEALQAISMFNGQTLYGYEMNVAIHIEPKPKLLPIGLGGIGKGFAPNGVPLKCVHSHLESRKIYDIFYRMGQVHQNRNREHPFVEYTPNITHPKLSSMNNPFDLTTTKPNAETAIEALGTVLIALDIIPSETNTKDLRSIVNALHKHPKVAQADKQHNIQTQGTTNQGPNNKVEAFYQNYSGLMQPMEQQYPGWSGHSQAAPTHTNQNTFGPNLNNTGPSNVQRQTFSTEPHIRPEHSNHPLHNMPILSKPTKEFVPPVFWSTNANAQSQPDGLSNMQNVPAGPSNLISNMQSFPAVTPHINPIMQSFPAVPPNINPNIQNFPLETNISPGVWNMNVYAPNEFDGMASMQNVLPGTSNINPNFQNFPAATSNINPNMQSFPAETPNINPYNMQNFSAGPSNMNPTMQSAPEIFAGNSNMNANMHMSHSSMPNIDTNEQNHSKPGVDKSMNLHLPGPENTKKKHAHPDKNRGALEAPAPPRWGDPRIQEILAGKNMTLEHSTDARVKTHTSNVTSKNRKSHNSNVTEDLRSHPSRPHYDPRSDSKKDNTMSSGDDFESDLLQFKNLPSSVTAKALGRKINEVGAIIFAEMTGKGKALVRFKRVKDAARCIRLFHRSKVDGHVIDVTPV